MKIITTKKLVNQLIKALRRDIGTFGAFAKLAVERPRLFGRCAVLF